MPGIARVGSALMLAASRGSDHVAVEIRVRLSGTVSRVADVFTIASERFRGLVVYVGAPASSEW